MASLKFSYEGEGKTESTGKEGIAAPGAPVLIHGGIYVLWENSQGVGG
jgi:hypothetical protein